MTPFQYVAPLTPVVIALGLTRILPGFGKILQLRGALLFLLCVIAAITLHARYHAVFAVSFLAYILFVIGINLRVLV